MALLRMTAPTPAEYLMPDQANNRLNGRNTQPNSLSIPCESQSFDAEGFFSSSALKAGESVRELIAEITVEIAMVIANCL